MQGTSSALQWRVQRQRGQSATALDGNVCSHPFAEHKTIVPTAASKQMMSSRSGEVVLTMMQIICCRSRTGKEGDHGEDAEDGDSPFHSFFIKRFRLCEAAGILSVSLCRLSARFAPGFGERPTVDGHRTSFLCVRWKRGGALVWLIAEKHGLHV